MSNLGQAGIFREGGGGLGCRFLAEGEVT